MESILTYILQINLLLTIVYFGYVFLLRGLTFYKLNRVYLFIGGLYAVLYPFLNVSRWFQKDGALPIPLVWDYVGDYLPHKQAETLTMGHFVLAVLAIGMFVLLLKLGIQLVSLLRIHLYSMPSVWQNYFFRNVVFPIAPFSFFNKIYVHQDQHRDPELYDIFKHEAIHVKGLHTVDVLLFEILLIGCWYNPFVWLMRKAVRQNLEFLTDQQVLDKGVDRQGYQYSLLNVTQHGTAVDIGNQFNFKTLKKRIMMMNKKRSSKIELSKYAFMLPLMLLAGATFTVNKADGKILELVESIKEVEVDLVKVDTSQQDGAYPLLGPSFNKAEVQRKNMHYEIDGKLVTLDEFLAIPRTDILGVDIYKDKGEILNKIGKDNSEGLFVMTTKSGVKQQKVVEIGVTFQSADTAKVGNGRIVLRNATGLAGAKPLMVLDGKPLGSDFELNAMPAEDIESITVLKDKSATALYGDKGKDGVILITSKKGLGQTGLTYKADSLYKGKMGEITVIGFANKKQEGGNLSAVTLDSQPEPQGGMMAFRKWIGDNYVYPSDAINAQVKGTVLVSFVVEKDGSLSNIRISRDLGYGTGENALSLLKKSPTWKPGLKDGRPVRVQYTLPIRLDVMTLQK